jgi:galactokinase
MDFQENDIRLKFIGLFQAEPLVVRSPGRINLIGEHTDYNDGFVMPASIDKEIVFAVAASQNQKSSIYSIKYDQYFEVDLVNPVKVENPKWANYLLGILYQLKEQGHPLKHFNCVFGGNIPMGAGLSSSAAMECGFAYAICNLNEITIPKIKLIKMAQWSEHNFVGVMCGIMDQFASVMGKEGSVIVLDCRSLDYKYSPIDLKNYTIVLCDTKVKHSLVDSEYNTRRSECEAGVLALKKYYPEINNLRDVTLEMLEKRRGDLEGKVYYRCLYIIQEIKRVQQASIDLNDGDLISFGKKMFDTHDGLSRLYEVSCNELDFLVDEAKKFDSVLGARMMGGGFGGCTINIVREDAVDEFISYLKEAYDKVFSINMDAYRVTIKDGTSIVSQSDVPVN